MGWELSLAKPLTASIDLAEARIDYDFWFLGFYRATYDAKKQILFLGRFASWLRLESIKIRCDYIRPRIWFGCCWCNTRTRRHVTNTFLNWFNFMRIVWQFLSCYYKLEHAQQQWIVYVYVAAYTDRTRVQIKKREAEDLHAVLSDYCNMYVMSPPRRFIVYNL